MVSPKDRAALPPVDPACLRRDIDAILDSAVHGDGDAWSTNLSSGQERLADTSNQIPAFVHPSD